MRRISILACALACAPALWGCDAVRPHAGIGIGTTVGNVHLGTGLGIDPLALLRRAGPATPRARVPAPAVRHLIPVRDFVAPDGRRCRDFYENVVIDGRAARSWGTACRQADGSWAIVSG